jgi:hypothetical protein
VDDTVTNGKTYYYVVTAVDTESNESVYSNEASVTLYHWGDLTFDRKVNMEDMAALSQGWQNAYDMSTLLDIANDWLLGPQALGYWSLDSNADDASGNGFDGAVYGNPTWVASGYINEAVQLDGVDDYIEISQQPTMDSSAFTVSFWARVDGGSGAFRSAFCARNTDVTGYVIYASNDNKWEFWSGGGSAPWQQLEGPAVQDGVWTHVAASFEPTAGPDGNGIYTGIKRLYINGTEVAQVSGSTYKMNTAQPVNIGRVADAETFYFNGLIDDVRIYDMALDQTQIQEVMN